MPRQSRRHSSVSRSKRLDGVAKAGPTDTGHPAGGRLAPEARVLSFLLLTATADHSLVAPVDTKYSRAQNCCSTKFLFASLHPRQMDRALPLINPINSATAYFGGIAISMCT